MEQAIAKAEILLEALKYIQAFRGKLVVVKVGGSAMDDEGALQSLLRDIVFMEAVGINPVLVHGGGKAISAEMARRRIEPQFVGGLRVSSPETVAVADEVLCNRVNPHIVESIRRLGGQAEPCRPRLNSCLYGRKHRAPGGPDLGLVGEITRVAEGILRHIIGGEAIPVLVPLAAGVDGAELYNVNADTAAAAVAGALRAEKFVLVCDVEGVRTGAEPTAPVADHLDRARIESLIANGAIKGGMLPKVRGCLKALEAGVNKCHIVSGLVPHALLLEIFSDRGTGTEIVRE